MELRQDLLNLINQFSDEQLALLMPLVLSFRENHSIESFSSETSTSYQAWVSAENDVYDDLFVDAPWVRKAHVAPVCL
jgi:cytoplasmic iron level regulating protein YaaA (DUF328/UPF0246 family)